jgi:microcystin degradation protein MlrC
MKIAVGGIHTECSTYSPLCQAIDDFTVVRGEALIRQCGLDGEEFTPVSFLPLFHARSIPGGPVTPDCYTAFREQFIAELQAAQPVDGVLLIMHGAMHVPDLPDPEGDWLTAVRRVIGPDVPVAVSYDLHGNVTQAIVDQIDIFCAYRTAPHIDVVETHLRAARHLVDQLNGGPRRLVAWAPVPVLLPGEKTSTEDEPAKTLYARLRGFDNRRGVCDANLMIGYVWADTARATAAAVVTGHEAKVTLETTAEIAKGYWDARNLFDFGVPTKCLEHCLDDAAQTSTGPFILADSGDNPTGGGVGDRSDILLAWLGRGLTDAVFAGIADPGSLTHAWPIAIGSSVRITIGGAFGSACPRVDVEAIVLAKQGCASCSDREVLVEIAGNLVILTERRRPFHRLEDFRKYGVNPEQAKFLVVKSGYLSPDLARIANPARMALTEGAVNQDILSLANLLRQRPSFPFQKPAKWQPCPRLSERAHRGWRSI